ncbi:MAG: hypothetical protein NTU78_17005 [Alphaproteobacteria bacterium]|nr:hypothetical protein [Alphaproteobacteria bacterium]
MEKPFEITEEFIIAVGNMTLAWAQVEIPLDIITGILFTRCDGALQYEKQIPRAFDRKATFCKKCFNNLPPVQLFKPHAVPIIQNCLDMADTRHRLIHGIVDNFTPVPDGTIILRRILYEPDRHSIEEHRITLFEIAKTTQAILECGAVLNTFSVLLAKHFRIVP